MCEVRSAIKRIDIPAIVAALIVQSLFFAQHVMRRPLLGDALADQDLGRTIGCRDQVGVAFVLHFQVLVEVMHQQCACFARNRVHGGQEALVIRRIG